MVSQKVTEKYQQTEEIVGSSHDVYSHRVLLLCEGGDHWDRTEMKIDDLTRVLISYDFYEVYETSLWRVS